MSDLYSLLSGLRDLRKEKAALEKTEKAVLVELKLLVDRRFDASPDAPIVEGSLTLTRVPGVSRSISAEALLERGVSPEVVAYATKTVTYYQYRVKEA